MPRLTEEDQAKVNLARTFGAPIDQHEAVQLLDWLSSLHDRPKELYSARLPVQENADGLWTARFRLPGVQERAEVVQALHEFVQECARSSRLDPETAAARGLSGVLIGDGDDGEQPHTIVLYRDPSGKYGTRSAMDLESQAARLEREFGLIREHEVFADGFMRCVMGRNTLYGGGSAFTLNEVHAALPQDGNIAMKGGYHFSTRPGWEKPYGEPSAILTTEADPASPESRARIIQAFSAVGWMLGRQDRWVLESGTETVPYVSNA